jgi:ATP-dependent DNA helicase RecG
MKLRDSVAMLPYVSQAYVSKLTRLGISTVGDLLIHFPSYHRDETTISKISEVQADSKVVLQAKVEGIKSLRIKGGRSMQTATLFDEDGAKIGATWFNQPFLENSIKHDTEYLISGTIKDYRGKLGIFPNFYEKIYHDKAQVHLGRIAPQYPLTGGITIKWLRNRINHIIEHLDEIEDLQVLQLQLMQVELDTNVTQALRNAHFPQDEAELAKSVSQLQELELTDLQLKLLAMQASRKKFKAQPVSFDAEAVRNFITGLAFGLTIDQELAVTDILADLKKDEPMTRLLQGDVGSGKTIVAAIAALATASAGKQTVILAPTTVLANQHAAKFADYFQNTPWSVSLVTGSTKSGKQIDQYADIVIGTSAVLARRHSLVKNLGLVIVDEQHRFGVRQRDELLSPLNLTQDEHPHVLSMTATPIPRTLAMALFSHLSVSSITTKPQGRLPIKTFLVEEAKRPDSYEWIREHVNNTFQQVYWICPLIEESEKSDTVSAKKTFETLQKEIFPDLKVELLHGKMSNDEKQKVMDNFASGETDILVSTSVIEVGIDVPNATVMVIEGAERFGMAQMHQIRGRVGRGSDQSWCFLFTGEEITSDAQARLEYFTQHTDGLEIATYDLHRRGPGEVYGVKQAGIPNLKIARLDNIELVRACRALADKFWALGIKRINLFARD